MEIGGIALLLVILWLVSRAYSAGAQAEAQARRQREAAAHEWKLAQEERNAARDEGSDARRYPSLYDDLGAG